MAEKEVQLVNAEMNLVREASRESVTSVANALCINQRIALTRKVLAVIAVDAIIRHATTATRKAAPNISVGRST